jgi:CBS domain-containing protein
LLGIISDRDIIGHFGNSAALEPDYLDKVTAADLMSTNLITVGPTTLLSDAVSRIVDAGINSLPVVDGGKTVGILTSTDIFLSLEQLLLATVPVPKAVG